MEEYGINVLGKHFIKGKIKIFPEDFIVEEIKPDGKTCTIDYTLFQRIKDRFKKKREEHLHLTLVKRNYTTIRATAQISRKLRISKNRIGYAGTKDKKALTAQRISVWNVKIEDVKKIKLKDIMLKEFDYSSERLNLGKLSGNKFTITVRGEYKPAEIKKKLEEFSEQIKNKIPNFFGPQRFGLQRPINHLVGKQLLLGNFEGAVMILLTAAGNENEEAKKARKFAAENWGEWNQILKIWPKTLGVESAVLNYLVKYPKDFANAFRKISKNLRRMFVHAFQSYVFNKVLSELFEEGEVPEEIPIIGHETQLSGKIKELIEKILREEDIKLEMFKLKRMPELSERGELRKSEISVSNFKVLKIDREKVKLQFFLEKGSYATILLCLLTGEFNE